MAYRTAHLDIPKAETRNVTHGSELHHATIAGGFGIVQVNQKRRMRHGVHREGPGHDLGSVFVSERHYDLGGKRSRICERDSRDEPASVVERDYEAVIHLRRKWHGSFKIVRASIQVAS